MVALKPSSLPMNSFSITVTMGRAEPRPVVVDGAVVIRKHAPLFVRTDHRMVNAFEVAGFINTLRSHLNDPSTLVEAEPQVRQAA
jgi:pyruvate/2-oxoglutarate dehydrogenase complex dihydrolipoamide acyltransferase (E2) component